MRCTEVADRPFPDGKFFGRDIGDRGRSSLKVSRVEWINVSDRLPETRDPCVTCVVDAMGKTHVNGGTRIGCFSPLTENEPRTEIATSSNPIEYPICSLFGSNAIADRWPDTSALTPLPNLNLATFGSYALEGEITELLLSSGAYRHSEMTPESAKAMSKRFVDLVAGSNRKYLGAYRTVVPWSNWFYDVAWDHTLVIVDGLRSRWWLLCTTDTD